MFSHWHTLLVPVLSLLLWALPAWAQLAVTYTPFTLPDVRAPLHLFQVQGVTPNGSLLLGGRFVDYLADPDLHLTALTCLPAEVPLAASSPREAFEATDLTPALDLVGTVETVDGLRGVLRRASGTCQVVHVPGSGHTILRAIDSPTSVAGIAIEPATSPCRGLRCWHGFVGDPQGAFADLTFGANSFVEPIAARSGLVIAHAQTNIQPDNSATFQAVWCTQLRCLALDDPDGHALYWYALSAAGLAIASPRLPTQPAPLYLIDLTQDPPQFMTLALPTAQEGYALGGVTVTGMTEARFVGVYTELSLHQPCPGPFFQPPDPACNRREQPFTATYAAPTPGAQDKRLKKTQLVPRAPHPLRRPGEPDGTLTPALLARVPEVLRHLFPDLADQ